MVLGGKHAPLYRQTFSELCVAAMRAARAHGQALLSLCEMTAYPPLPTPNPNPDPNPRRCYLCAR